MPRNFSLPALTWPPRTAAAGAQFAVVVLLALNAVAAFFAWRPIGGSAEQLEQEMIALRGQVIQKRIRLEQSRQNVSKVQSGRSDGDAFMQTYFLGERTAYSNVVGEILKAAKEAKITAKEQAYSLEPIDGSIDLATMIVTANFEGTYADLIEFINRLDRSDRLIIIESLNATPQQGGAGRLNVAMKLDAFVRQDPVVEQQ